MRPKSFRVKHIRGPLESKYSINKADRSVN